MATKEIEVRNLSGDTATVTKVEGQALPWLVKWPVHRDAKVLVGTALYRNRRDAMTRAETSRRSSN